MGFWVDSMRKARHVRMKLKATPEGLPKVSGVPIEAVLEPHPRSRERPSLAKVNPEAAGEWYYEKNCGFGPEDFSYGSQVNVWWQCSENKEHVWRTRILTRGVQKRNCPQCSGTYLQNVRVPKERSLAYCFPKLAHEWHPTRNKGVTPRDFLANSKMLVWWQCSRNKKHAWECDPSRRIQQNAGCPHCYDERLLDLRDFPEVLCFFDKKKNKGINPNRLTVTTEVWWRCPAGPDHVWYKPFRDKKKSFECPFCRHRKPSVTNNLAVLFPELAKELHPTKNGKLQATGIASRSCMRVWWRCAKKHVWEAIVRNRTMNRSGCPECWVLRRPAVLAKVAAKHKRQPTGRSRK